VHYKRIILLIYLLSQTLYAKPLIHFIVSSDCPHCHTLMKDINENPKLMLLLSKEYKVNIIDTINTDVPKKLPFDGKVPTIIITNNNAIVGETLKGLIPSTELMKYLFQIINYLKNNNKEVYYVY